MAQKLTTRQQQLYSAAINKGFITDNTPAFWHSFCGTWIRRHPNRTSLLVRLRQILGHAPEWDDLTDETLADLRDDLLAEMAPNSVRTICAELRAHLTRWAPTKPIKSQTFTAILRAKKEPSQGVYLTRAELTRLHEYIPDDPRERYVKELFMRECLIGARAVDAHFLTVRNIHPTDQGEVLTYIPKKHPIEVNVPVHRWLRDYLNEDWPEAYVRKTRTDYQCVILRRICLSCGINKPVTIYRAGENHTGLKYEFVGTHTGRRTFATLLSLRGCPIEQIALMMGHITGRTPNITMTAGYIMEKQPLSSSTFRLFQ